MSLRDCGMSDSVSPMMPEPGVLIVVIVTRAGAMCRDEGAGQTLVICDNHRQRPDTRTLTCNNGVTWTLELTARV